MSLDTLIAKACVAPASIEFPDMIAAIDNLYDFAPTAFKNGDLENATGQNNGSCELFAFAKLQRFGKEQKPPAGTDHVNIRSFIKFSWNGIAYAGVALKAR